MMSAKGSRPHPGRPNMASWNEAVVCGIKESTGAAWMNFRSLYVMKATLGPFDNDCCANRAARKRELHICLLFYARL